MGNILEVVGLNKSYKNFSLADVSFTLPEDCITGSQLLEIMRDYMKRGGKGVFFSTHITSDLDKVADMLILIHDGKILFEQEKDALMDGFRLVKGDIKALNAENRNLFLSVRENEFGFAGITDKLAEVRRSIPDVLAEKPSIEDIMLGYIERGA